ncbi:hypothetical protein N8I77_007679 [Diaporthe amygdali]|uniref:Uncharacterized protein n=1 Tax=Phomopsis amygdali TaxID=1214568 RepID=A0AAD9W264_PHOAM|nr:hypothetical protein N8I77_007679 [Diaporthe amygdali]
MWHPPEDFQVSFARKTVLVTGANTGLGFEAAVKYVALGAEKLILAVRSAAKGEDAKKRILERTGRSSGDVAIAILTVDLADFASVRGFVRNLHQETPHLDVALLNAGLANPKFEQSSTGWEMAVQVNVLSTALMAVLLLPLLRATAAARIKPAHLTFVNSHGHDMVQKDWYEYAGGSLLKACNDKGKWDAARSYSMVKLMGMAVMQAVARGVTKSSNSLPSPQHPDIIVNAVCPGLCKTDLGRNFGTMSQISGFFFQGVFARTAEEGSRSLVSATALGPESHGRLWHHDILFPVGDIAKDEDFMKQTWAEILDVVSQTQPNLQGTLVGEA